MDIATCCAMMLFLCLATSHARCPVGRLSEDVLVTCNNETDCTESVQEAFDHPDTFGCPLNIVLPFSDRHIWFVRPLFLRKGNRNIIFEPGITVMAKKGEFRSTSDSLLTLESVSNVTVEATGATLQMRKSEYAQPPYTRGEWRMALSIRGCSNVTVHGGTYRESGGDGIYIAGGPNTLYSSNISISDVTADGNWRNGLSVISVDGLTVSDSLFVNTNGTNPQCGIDLEPDAAIPPMRMERVVFRNVTLTNNTRCGFQTGLYGLANSTRNVSVLVDGMAISSCGFFNNTAIDVGGHGSGLYLSNSYKPTGGVRGIFSFRNISIQHTNNAAVEIQSWRQGLIALSFQGLVIKNAAIASTYPGGGFVGSANPIVFESGSDDPNFQSGSVDFGDDGIVYDNENRPYLHAGHIKDVVGVFTVVNSPKLHPLGCVADTGSDPVHVNVTSVCK